MSDRENNFGALRWLAALAVILAHAYALRQEGGLYQRLTGLDLGWSAVVVFFTLSGFLICRSAERRTPLAFWTARLLRIFPGLVVCTALTAAALATVTTLPLADYAVAPQTLRFALGTGTLVSTEYALPGVFADHPVTLANGSLWTLRYELLCYALIFGLVEAARHLRLPLARILPVCIALCVAGRAALAAWGHGPVQAANLLELFLPFCIGAWFAVRGAPAPRPALVALAIGAACVLAPTPLRVPAAAAAIALATLALAFWRNAALRAASRLPDYSYGIYIYAYPIQQIVLGLTPGAHPLVQALASAVLVIGPAALSWHLVERPALTLKVRRMLPAEAARAPG
jgi:peptidoglycan/LPS O-acetylase OafA/YrhL